MMIIITEMIFTPNKKEALMSIQGIKPMNGLYGK